MEFQKRLYVILYPNHALVASQLSPDKFAAHYQVGSGKYYGGKVIFAEVNPNFRNAYFDIDKAFTQLVPHADGSPKKTKFVASYRVLEHIDLDAIQALYISTPRGWVQKLEPAVYTKTHKPGYVRTFAEISPLSMISLSSLNAVDFGKYITKPGNPKGAPQLFFTQIELDADAFLLDYDRSPLMSSPIPFVHPSKLKEGILAVKNGGDSKQVKGMSVYSDMNNISYGKLRHGFWFASQDKYRFFPMPDMKELSEKNPHFFRDI